MNSNLPWKDIIYEYNTTDIFITELADKYKTTRTIIKLYFNKNGIPTSKKHKKCHNKITDDILNEFINTEKGLQELSKFYDLNYTQIRQYCKENNIIKHYGKIEYMNQKIVKSLFDKYMINQISVKKISEQLNVSCDIIRKYLKDNNIKNQIKTVEFTKLNEKQKDNIVNYYFADDKNTLRKTSKHMNISKDTFAKIMKERNITLTNHFPNKYKKDAQFLWRYTNISCEIIGKIYGFSEMPILKIVKDIKREHALPKQKLKWIEYFQDHNMTIKQISKKVGLSYEIIQRYLQKSGIPLSTKFTKEVEIQIKNEYVNDLKTSNQLAKKYGCDPSTICDIVVRCGGEMRVEYRQSSQERENIKWLKSLNLNVVVMDREILKKCKQIKEIDIYLPDYNFAIEHDGIYFHNEINKIKNYHLMKTDKCNEKGIQLFHVFEDEWVNKEDIVKSMILNKIGKTKNKIFARKCEIKDVQFDEVKTFLDFNHIQGRVKSNINIGLYYNNELVSLMCFNKSRFNKNYDWELSRFCNKLNTTVIGGASKLFKHFTRNYNGSIISYSDLRYSNGKLYETLEFKHLKTNPPNYSYVRGQKRIRKEHFRKHKLKKIFDDYSDEKTEVQMMNEHGYYRIFDCGTKVWIYN